MVHQPLERVLTAGDEAFDERSIVRVVSLGAHVRRSHDGAQPIDRGRQRGAIVDAYHAAASGERRGLEHARKWDLVGGGDQGMMQRNRRPPWNGKASLAERFA